ncbi:MAG: imidazole glycerol phosphate synthase subunit HisH [Eubacteriales bacterium]|nr:imidazole glycerol phosphate synthase subunit HisH [Eubacteriales bacterium]
MIAILDYEMGNLGSVAKALTYLGQRVEITSDPATIAKADRVILPGVGAMSYAAEQLQKKGLDLAIGDFLKTGRPFLGVCLGMQLMFEASEEGDAKGLGILPGIVRRFQPQPGLKIPHMGWNQLTDSRLALLPEGQHFYFVHSYYCDPADDSIVAAWSQHGTRFAAAVQQDNILLTQFHPEKSGDSGLKLLSDWIFGGED